MIEIPRHLYSDTDIFNEWFSRVVYDFFHVRGKESPVREYAIVEYRFGLNGKSTLTLEEVGIVYDITRERVRQIEKNAIRNLALLINEGSNPKRKIFLQKDVFERIQGYRNSFNEFSKVANELVIVAHTSSYFSEASIDLPLLRLLLTLFGFEKISLDTGSPDPNFAWAIEPVNINRYEDAMRALRKYLKNVAIAKPFDEIKIALTKRNKKKHFSDDELNLAIDLAYDIERLADGTIQMRYERLRSVSDKAYRILHNAGEPMRSREIAIALNKESIKHGEEKSRVTAHHIGTRLSNDARFVSIGRTGGWILREWDDYSTDTILNLMADALHASGKPLSSTEIYNFVSARRPVKRTAVTSYLAYDKRFTRVGMDLFALSDWGIPAISSSRSRPVERVLSKAKLCEYIELIFEDNETDEMFVADLARSISEIEPSITTQSIYNSIMKSPAVKIVDRVHGRRKRKIAMFEPSYRSRLTKLEILTKDVPVRVLIQNTVRRLLSEQPNGSLRLVDIRDKVSSELHCPPASVYSAVSEMEDVKKEEDTSGQTVCVLLKPTARYDEVLMQITDEKLVAEINRALDLANLDGIDLALFQLGKIFEYVLKRYMQEYQRIDPHSVSQKDMSRLFDMVQWAGTHHIITDTTALQYLRIERNQRAHGVPPDEDERKVLLDNAPMTIRYYLSYIALLEQRREALLSA